MAEVKYFNTLNFVIAGAALLVVLYTLSDTFWKPSAELELPTRPTIAELPAPEPPVPEPRVPVATAQAFSPRRVGTTETTPVELTVPPESTARRTPQVIPRQRPRPPATTQVGRPSIPLGVPSAPSARSRPGRIANPPKPRQPSVRRPRSIPAPGVANRGGAKRERGEGRPAPPPVRASAPN